jgi:hypothetical protein
VPEQDMPRLDAKSLRIHRLNFERQVSSYLRVLSSALSAFSGIAEKAEELTVSALEHLQSMDVNELIRSDFIDQPNDLVEMAEAAGSDYLLHQIALRQGIVNLFAVGLYHLFEQQIAFIYKLNVAPLEKRVNLRRFLDAAESWGIDPTKFASWHEIDELGNVANCVKHGEGPACERLRENWPALLGNAAHIDSAVVGLQMLGVSQPLFGENLYLPEQDLLRHGSAIKEFWKELECVAAERFVTGQRTEHGPTATN